jgi:alpha-L-arabinofuranosidase
MIQDIKKVPSKLILTSMTLSFICSSFILTRSYQDTVRAQSGAVTLNVNASKIHSKFSKNMLGVGFVNWEHAKAWGKPFLNEIPALKTTLGELKPGILRYAGGLWANSVGWDRTNQRTPYTEWTYQGDTAKYYFHYGKDEIDSLGAFAKTIGSDVMIQVNVAINNPQMWADMVKYTNIEQKYGFKYWELGNELDHDQAKGITPEVYATRAVEYEKALHAVDPTIKIIYGVPAYTVPQSDSATWLSPYLTKPVAAIKQAGKTVDSASFHWYQGCNMTKVSDATTYSFGGIADTSWRNAYARNWAEIMPRRIRTELLSGFPQATQGITELNVDACNYDNKGNGNHVAGIWFSDILGRLAYSGLDYATMYEGYGAQRYAAVLNMNNTTTVSSVYYAMMLYSRYFGDNMVETSTTNNNLSIWASTDSKDLNKLKLIVTNISEQPTTGNINLQGFTSTATSAKGYEIKSPQSITQSGNINADYATTLNGVTLNASNIAGSLSSVQPKSIPVQNNAISYSFPAFSATSIIIDGNGGATTTPTPIITTTSNPTTNPTTTATPTVTCAKKVNGDSNCDNSIDLIDYSNFRTEFIAFQKKTLDINTAKCDFNGDKSIDLSDFSAFRQGYVDQRKAV